MASAPDMSRRPIILKTIYHFQDSKSTHLLVTTYKTEAKGEEHFGGCVPKAEYNLDHVFVHRVFTLVGSGTHIPLVNSRIMLDPSNQTASMNKQINPYPRTSDYRNPCKREGKNQNTELRLSIGSLSLVNFTPEDGSSSFVGEELLREIYSSGSLNRMERKSRVPVPDAPAKAPDTRKITRERKDKKVVSLFESKKPGQVTIRTSSPLPSTSTSEVKSVIPSFDWASEKKKVEESDFDQEKSLTLRKLISICIQNNIVYSKSVFGKISSATEAEKELTEAMRELHEESKLSELRDIFPERLTGINLILVTKGAKVIGMTHVTEKTRGIEIRYERLGITVVDDNVG